MRQLSEKSREEVLQNRRDSLQNTFSETLSAQGMRAWRNGRRKGLKIPSVAARKGLSLQNKPQICTENDGTNRELQNTFAGSRPLLGGRVA
jgi:hypothetical protein